MAAVASTNPLFTDQQKNAEILKEAAITDYSLLGNLFGFSLGNPLSITQGKFTPSGWSFALTGMYLGMPVALDFSGSFDEAQNTGSFTTGGTVGNTSMNGSGAWSWIDVSNVESDLNFGTGLTSSDPPPSEHDLETVAGLPKKYLEFPKSKDDVFIIDFGTDRKSVV